MKNLLKLNELKSQYDVVVVGAGFAGATTANLLARKNKKVLIVEKRDHIGGNMYDYYDKNGVLVHKYGPHIFHTFHESVYEYLKQFGEFFSYEHKVKALVDGVLIPVPFNFESLEILYGNRAEELKNKLRSEYPVQTRVSIYELMNDKDKDIKEFGEFVFEKIFVHYTAKQWGIKAEEVDKSVINRVPVVLGYEDAYFADQFQYMPKEGFTKLFENMLDNENIDILLNTPINDVLRLENGKIYLDDKEYKGDLIFTGAIDELLGYQFGPLPYRSLKLDFESLDMTYYQSNSVINYTTSEDFTRITEFKYLSNQNIEGHTVILREYPLAYTKENYKKECPYYPIQNKENEKLYNQYKDLLKDYPQIHLLGRLAEYKYYNMDAVILKSFEFIDKYYK